MDTPGYDPVSATGQVAGGANMICFTTGRGSAYGCTPSPSLKLATNTPLWRRRKRTWTSTAATIVDGTETIQADGRAHLRADPARPPRARRPRARRCGFGEDEFVPWKLGATM